MWDQHMKCNLALALPFKNEDINYNKILNS